MKRASYGDYWVWADPATGKFRWALKFWPDDGFGMQSHGGANSLQLALTACDEHQWLKAMLRTNGDVEAAKKLLTGG